MNQVEASDITKRSASGTLNFSTKEVESAATSQATGMSISQEARENSLLSAQFPGNSSCDVSLANMDDYQEDKHADETQSNSDDKNMTEAERILANRLRNREHARNTRLRKKAYLENLKATLDELCRERDILVSERANAASMLLEMQRTRTDVLLSFFALRTENEKRRNLWSSILAESFTCAMPVTPYRSFPSSEVQVYKCQRTVLGVDGIMADTASLHVALNCLVNRKKYPDAQVKFKYTIVAEESVVAGNQMMARWNMTTTNATKFGLQREIGKHSGMLCVRFSKAHKIVSMELMFDVMAFMIQLKQHAEYTDMAVVPNTVQTCKGPFNVPMVMTIAERPYTIVQVNRRWEEMTGWKAEEVVGKSSCAILQGEQTNPRELNKLMHAVRFKHPVFVTLTNHSKGNKHVFRHYMNVYPLSTDSKITHYVAFSLHVTCREVKSSSTKKSKSQELKCDNNMNGSNPKNDQSPSGDKESRKLSKNQKNKNKDNSTQNKDHCTNDPRTKSSVAVFANGTTDLSSLTSSLSSASGKGSIKSTTSSRSIGTIPTI